MIRFPTGTAPRVRMCANCHWHRAESDGYGLCRRFGSTEKTHDVPCGEWVSVDARPGDPR